ncbi:isoleucyl-tRNA synthetase [Ardenticatena maritima]|uniref:Isoleucine--tRNA ligase n=1 Tax=Ardenticatena maritima TaxID=872965 RepID=A0A0M9UCW9_9CHLR|nr:isoleucine--tRNA ligase [Ardenticatena maritima]KPL87718.1 isoleucyl-tRNA synthase [Ardenticatena maritima]GAP63320.1 isoleucyl-tRNA synthetase [Ardenticatena maritima]
MTVFEPVSNKPQFVEEEKRILDFWKQNRIFEKSVEQREGAEPWVFYEGPPTANGLPHIGHVLTRVYKDIFPRYRTMKGRYVLRKAGWDTHGLPVELEVEKQLGLTGKKQIEEYGVAEFNKLCRESVFRYVEKWRELTDRIGFWIDLDHPYVTMENSYIETIWWILKNFWERDLLYRDYKVVPYCPRCGTPLASHEVSLGYAETEDPSVYVKFPVADEEGVYLLAWTTTPWTLPGNVALAVGEDIDYVKVRHGDDVLILAKERLSVLDGDYEILAEMKGKDLAGIHYRPLYRFLPVEQEYAYVVTADFVSIEDGTGIVHIAPAFGADDMNVGRQYGLPVLLTVNDEGRFIPEVKPWAGMFVKEADPLIIEDLQRRGLLYKAETYVHNYPFCWRCKTPLLYYARPTWYIQTTRYKEQLLENNRKINWVPEHIRDGRFGNWLENNIDWALGRERYWATPLPVWTCDECGEMVCIGSVKELEERTGQDLSDLDLHRPYVDEITFACEACGGTMRRVPEVIDVWFDSGAMPYAQWHYPFENEDIFKQQYPADFICEAVDQTRGWFYSLHAISTLLFNQPAYKNCVVLGLILDEEGQKMSKSKGNVVDPWDVLNVHGADAVRWYFFVSAPPWAERRFGVNVVEEVVRRFLLTLWNTYAFFVTYANIADWNPATGETPPVAERPLMDKWLLSELHQLIKTVDAKLDGFDATGAARAIDAFVDQLSNWYVRRNRRRFWDGDAAAFATLYETLVLLSQLLAPFTPFLADNLWQNLVRRVRPDAAESVHLTDFPVADDALIDETLNEQMALVQTIASLGLSARNKAQLKVRQPLRAVVVSLPAEERAALENPEMQAILLDELNVKELRFASSDELATYKVGPNPAKLGPKYGKLFKALREYLNTEDNTPIARALLAGQTATVTVEGQTLEIAPDEATVETLDAPGYAVVTEGPYTVAVTTDVDDALRREGLARDIVRHLNQLRKEADYNLTDRIVVWVHGDSVQEVLDEWRDYIAREALATEVKTDAPPADVDAQQRVALDGGEVVLAVKRP